MNMQGVALFQPEPECPPSCDGQAAASPSGTSTSARTGRSRLYTAEELINLDLTEDETSVIIGSSANPLIRVGTRNFIEAPEKAFKTTIMLRLALGMSVGATVFPELPIPTKPRRVLYLHGELGLSEIQDRTIAAAVDLPHPLDNLIQGRVIDAHLITPDGQKVITGLIKHYGPEVLVLDPYQAFIAGADENTFRDVSVATKFLDGVIENFGVTLFVPIHLGKDHSRGARGHSSLAGWRDTRIQLTRNEKLITVTLEPRWATPPRPFRLEFHNGTVRSRGPAFTAQTDQIREFVSAHGGLASRRNLKEYLDITEDALRKALARAREAGAIDFAGDQISLQQ